MASTHNTHLLEIVKEITAAKLSNPSTKPSELDASSVSEFMQVIYDKLIELDNAN